MPDGIQILGQYTHVTDFGKRQTELALHIQQKLNHIPRIRKSSLPTFPPRFTRNFVALQTILKK